MTRSRRGEARRGAAPPAGEGRQAANQPAAGAGVRAVAAYPFALGKLLLFCVRPRQFGYLAADDMWGRCFRGPHASGIPRHFV